MVSFDERDCGVLDVDVGQEEVLPRVLVQQLHEDDGLLPPRLRHRFNSVFCANRPIACIFFFLLLCLFLVFVLALFLVLFFLLVFILESMAKTAS